MKYILTVRYNDTVTYREVFDDVEVLKVDLINRLDNAAIYKNVKWWKIETFDKKGSK